MTTEAAWAFAERIAKDIAAQDRQLISSRAMGMIAAEFDAATLHPTAREQARDALVAAALIWRGPDESLKIENDLVDAVDAYLATVTP